MNSTIDGHNLSILFHQRNGERGAGKEANDRNYIGMHFESSK